MILRTTWEIEVHIRIAFGSLWRCFLHSSAPHSCRRRLRVRGGFSRGVFRHGNSPAADTHIASRVHDFRNTHLVEQCELPFTIKFANHFGDEETSLILYAALHCFNSNWIANFNRENRQLNCTSS